MARSLTTALTLAASLASLAVSPSLLSAIGAPPAKGGTGIALIEIEHTPREEPAPLAWLTGSGDEPTLRELIAKFHDVEADTGFSGLVVRLKSPELKTTQVEEIGKAMDAVRASGKKVHLFADGYETKEFMLGSHADELILQTGGAVSLPGMHMEEMYLADTLAWVGLTPQLVQVGDYKGANEQMMRSSPSPQWEENISKLLDGLYANVRERVKTSRKLTDAQLDEAMKKAWLANGETAKATGLIDAVCDLPELTDHLKKSYSTDDIEWTSYEPAKKHGLDMGNPLQLLAKLGQEPDIRARRDSIAVLHITGAIIDGESTQGGLTGEAQVGSFTIRRALGEIEDDDLIKGVIVRIDSPGGSAIASEVIWQGVKRLTTTKPVWISVGSIAASGGYYVAVSGQKIYVNPSSIVGSIGVVGGKVALGGAYDKLKIHVVNRGRGPMANMFASSTPWTDVEKAFVREKMKETYDLFESRVKQGRAGINTSMTAAGRLFTGNDAIALKMADKVGGLEDTITDLASELKLASGQYDVLDFPSPRPAIEVFGQMLGKYMGASAPVASTRGEDMGSQFAAGVLREVVGPKAWPSVRDSLGAMLELRREPVLLVAPHSFIIR